MNQKELLELFNHTDDRFVAEAIESRSAVRVYRPRIFALAAVIALVCMMMCGVAYAQSMGWFYDFFARNSEGGLSSEQIEYIDANEQIVKESQTNDGYALELKSVLSDGSITYVIVGITAPADVTQEDLGDLWGSEIELYDENQKPCRSFSMDVMDDLDGLENTVDLVFELETADWNRGTLWTLRINTLGKVVYDREYRQELLETKYAGQENVMFTDEEAARIQQLITLAEGPWEFVLDLNLSSVETEAVELIADPVSAQTCSGFTKDGEDIFEEVRITSVILSPLRATIQTDCNYAPDFTAGGRKVYVVMDDGSRIELRSDWGSVGNQHFIATAPIVLDDVAYILLPDGTKLPMPR